MEAILQRVYNSFANEESGFIRKISSKSFEQIVHQVLQRTRSLQEPFMVTYRHRSRAVRDGTKEKTSVCGYYHIK